MARICPDCSTELQKKDFHGVTIDACPKCAGIFFDEGEVNEVRRQAPGALEELDAMLQPQEMVDPFKPDHPRQCPQCGVVMAEYRYLYSSPIVLNSCDRCGGIWAQNGELQLMAEYLRGSQGEDSQSAVVAQMKNATSDNIDRAKRMERSMRWMSRRVHGGF